MAPTCCCCTPSSTASCVPTSDVQVTHWRGLESIHRPWYRLAAQSDPRQVVIVTRPSDRRRVDYRTVAHSQQQTETVSHLASKREWCVNVRRRRRRVVGRATERRRRRGASDLSTRNSTRLQLGSQPSRIHGGTCSPNIQHVSGHWPLAEPRSRPLPHPLSSSSSSSSSVNGEEPRNFSTEQQQGNDRELSRQPCHGAPPHRDRKPSSTTHCGPR